MSTRLITKHSNSIQLAVQPEIEGGSLTDVPIIDEKMYGNRESKEGSNSESGFVQKSLEALYAYVPVEITAAYIGAINFFTDQTDSRVLWIALIMFMISAPFYTYVKIRKEESGKGGSFPKWQCLMTLIIFCAWSYGIGGLWVDLGLHDSEVALLIMLGATLILPLIGQDENGNPVWNF